MYKIASRYFLYSLGLIAIKKVLKRDTTSSAPEVPSFRGVVEVIHSIEGRIRFKVPSLKDDTQGLNDLNDQLSRISSIKSVQTNSVTGTVLIVYTDEIEPTLLMGIMIKLLGLQEKVQKGTQSLVTKEFKSVEESLNLAIDEKTNGMLDLKSLMFLALSIIGIRKMIKYPTNTPPGFNYLWWGYTAISL